MAWHEEAEQVGTSAVSMTGAAPAASVAGGAAGTGAAPVASIASAAAATRAAAPPASISESARAAVGTTVSVAAGAAGGTAAARPAPAARCRGLRWKGMFIDSPPDPSIPNPHDGFFWCRHTLTCLGPDREVADDESCLPGRTCYEGY
jgi:hypothetical protein